MNCLSLPFTYPTLCGRSSLFPPSLPCPFHFQLTQARFHFSTGEVFPTFSCAVRQWYTEHQTSYAPKATISLFFYQKVLVLVPLPKHCTSKIRSTWKNRYYILYSAKKSVAVAGTTDAMQELQAAENHQFWITTSEGTPEKRPNYKRTLEVSQPRWLLHH